MIKLSLYLILPILLLLLPANYFDEGKSICISMLLFDSKCYGCGITRAMMHFIHFDFKSAFEFNKLVVVVGPLLIYSFTSSFVKDFKRLKSIR